MKTISSKRWDGKRWRRVYGHGLCEICKKKILVFMPPAHRKQRFCSRKCKATTLIGKSSPNWKGGRKLNAQGYWELYKPTHLNASVSGYVLEHRWVMSEICDRPLEKHEIVHHINSDIQDNRPGNLMIMSKARHTSIHQTGKSVSMKTRKKLSILATNHPQNRDSVSGRFVSNNTN